MIQLRPKCFCKTKEKKGTEQKLERMGHRQIVHKIVRISFGASKKRGRYRAFPIGRFKHVSGSSSRSRSRQKAFHRSPNAFQIRGRVLHVCLCTYLISSSSGLPDTHSSPQLGHRVANAVGEPDSRTPAPEWRQDG